jgi:uncharacterized RDD family membrane protein YckC
MIQVTIYTTWGAMALSLLAALAISWLMAKYRTSEYRPGSPRDRHRPATGVHFAPLWRRAVARGVDAMFYTLPLLPLWNRAMEDLSFERLFDLDLLMDKLLEIAVLVSAALGLWLLAMIVFSFTEGRWGRTPGKWLMGNRVVRTDLRPCGFGRALARNLILIVDEMFSYLVAIGLIAFTENRQRLGDMAVGTIVVRARREDEAAEPNEATAH